MCDTLGESRSKTRRYEPRALVDPVRITVSFLSGRGFVVSVSKSGFLEMISLSSRSFSARVCNESIPDT